MVTRTTVLAALCLVAVATGAEPIRVVSEDAEGVVVEVSTARPRFVDVSRGGRAYLDLRLAQWSDAIVIPGQPVVPSARFHLYVPPGATVTVEPQRVAPPVRIPLGRDIAFAERIPVHDGRLHLAERNDAAYRAVYGDRLAEIEEQGWAGRDRIAAVRVSPIRYDAATRRLRWTPSFRLRFRFTADSRAILGSAIGGDSVGIARYLVLNAASFPAPERGGRRVDFLIVHESHRAAIQRLVQFKRMSGREVRVSYVTGKTTQQIHALIKAEYQRADPPTHTILVGNIDQIPAWAGSGDNKRTDYPYQKIDGDDLPDISLGRIPAHDAAELGAFIDKAISREIEPRNVAEVLLTAGKDTQMGCPANVTKVGEELKKGGSDIRITQKYRTQVSTEAIIDGYNAEPNLIVYDGHGHRAGMTEVPLLIDDLDKLTSRNFPLILDIACLNANWMSTASPRNFAEMILLKPGKGAAGIMASGGSGYGHEFFRTLGRIMAEARLNLSQDTKMNEIGQVILAAKVKHNPEDRAFWNYYGDPASSVWETTIGR